MNEELIKLAKECKSIEEIIALAKEKNVELTEAEAKSYFAMLNKKNGELSDEELNAAGGTTYNCDGRVRVTSLNWCELYKPNDPRGYNNEACMNCYHCGNDEWGKICTIRRKGNDPIND